MRPKFGVLLNGPQIREGSVKNRQGGDEDAKERLPSAFRRLAERARRSLSGLATS